MQHFPVFASYNKNDLSSSIKFKHAGELSDEEKTAIWGLFEANMKDVYQADNQKWNPKEKRRELFDVSTSSGAKLHLCSEDALLS